ncbi:MAG: tetratricopeptide (TPR) repeat protein/O-antigen ligase [Kiritimatiellia bacterium]|jgi:tetratricopeptide (TPR) repeat protein/O-antigen ligase
MPADAHSKSTPIALSLPWMVAVGVFVFVPLFWAGSVHHVPRAVAHGLALVVLTWAAVALPNRLLAKSGRLLAPVGVPLAVALLGALCLVPLPLVVLQVLSPGTASAFVGFAWHPLAVGVPDVVIGVGIWTLAASSALSVGLIAVALGRRFAVQQIVVWTLVALGFVALVHAGLGVQRLFGIWPITLSTDHYWAPLVNGNHMGTLVILLLPTCVGTVLRPTVHVVTRIVAAVGAVAGLVILAGVASLGAVGALGVVALIVGLRLLKRAWMRLGIIVASVAAAMAGVWYWARVVDRRWVEGSLLDRADQWWTSLALFPMHPWFGVAPHGYRGAFPPVQPPMRFLVYGHVHNDWLEVLLEIGVVGVLIVGLIVVLSPRPKVRSVSRRATWIGLGLAGVAVHSLVEFPMHIPGVLIAVLALWAVRYANWDSARSTSAVMVRAVMVVLAIAQVPLAGFSIHQAVERSVVVELRQAGSDAQVTQAANTLSTMSPWLPQPALAMAKIDLKHDDKEAAIRRALQVERTHPENADALRRAAMLLAAAGDVRSAERVALRSAQRFSGDYRTHNLLSRLAQARGDQTLAASRHADALRRWPPAESIEHGAFARALSLVPVPLWWLDEIEYGAHPALSLYLGDEVLRRGDPEQALIAYEQAERLWHKAAAWPNRGHALYDLGRVEEALAYLRLVADEGENQNVRIELARLYRLEGRYDDARRELLQALKFDPHNSGVQAQLLILPGVDRASLVALLEHFRVDGPVDDSVILQGASAFLRIESADECVRLLDRTPARDVEHAAKFEELLGRCLTACKTCGLR